METISFVGTIVYVNIRNKKVFNVKVDGNRIRCQSTIALPIEKGDRIEANCYVDIDNNDQEYFRIIGQPIIWIDSDKQNVINSICIALKSKKIDMGDAENIYNAICLLGNGNVPAILSNLSQKYVEFGKECEDIQEIISPISKDINPEKMYKLLQWWHDHHAFRRLQLLGLTESEIKGLKLTYNEIYRIANTNPYRLITVKMEKCDMIKEMLYLKLTEDHRDCGLIARSLLYNQQKYSWACTPKNILYSAFTDINIKKLFPMLEEDYGIVDEYGCYYLPYAREAENSVAERLITQTKSAFRNKVKYFGDESEITLNENQKRGIERALERKVSIITGYAGSGKTSLVKYLCAMLKQFQIGYVILSFTGKAVSRIKQLTKEQHAYTIHKAISAKKSGTGEVPYFSFVIFDETSMITTELMYEFMCAYEQKLQYCFIGDPNQLEPIGWGSFFDQIIKSNKIVHTKLKTIYRYGKTEYDGITSNAKKVLNGEEVTDEDNFELIDGDHDDVGDICRKLAEEKRTATILTPMNRDVDELNDLVQEIFNPQSLEYPKKEVIYNGITWREGDRIMMLENEYDINVMNGEEGKLIYIEEGCILHVDFDGRLGKFYVNIDSLDEKEVKDMRKELGVLDLNLIRHSFACTVHKSQGSQWPIVIVYIGETRSNFVNKRLEYVAFTRAEDKVFVVGDIYTVKAACRRYPSTRHENLANRIIDFMTVI